MKSPLRRLPYIYVLILLPCFIYTVFYTVRALRLDYVDIPTWDAWRCVLDLDALCRLDLRPLWRQHNEHRVIAVQLLYWVDFGLLHGHQFLLVGCEIVCQLAQLALLWWLLHQMKEIPLPFRLAFAAGCGILMTTAIHVQAMVIPFLVQWYLAQGLVFFALLFLWRAAQKRPTSLILSIAAAVVVTYTTGNGMLLWPVLVGLAVLLRLPRKQIAALAIAAAITIALYFMGYRFVGQGNAIRLLGHPLYAAGFMAIFLGAPASYLGNAFGGAMGWMGMALTMIALVMAIRRRHNPDVVSIVAVGFCLFIVFSALMVAYGRINPADPTFLKAKAVRYAMIALAFWASLVVLVGWILTRLSRGRQYLWHLAAAAMTAALLVAVIGQQEASERAGAVRQARAAEAAIGLETAVQDREDLSEVYQDPAIVWERTPVLRARRLSLFATGRQDWIGHPIYELFALGAAGLCSGSMDAVTVVDNGFRAEGRAFDLGARQPPKDIVLVDAERKIVGLGATRAGGYPRPPARPRKPPSDLDWVGFAPADRSSRTLQAYAIVGDGKTACPLGSPRPIPVRTTEKLSPLWLPGDRPPLCSNARMQMQPHWIEITPLTGDPQLLFNIGPALAGVRTLVIRARFQKADRIDAFFGKQVDGRAVSGIVPVTNQWVDVYLNMSHNPFWEREHGQNLRFDPVSSAGAGTRADIAGIWGSTEAADPAWPDVQFYALP